MGNIFPNPATETAGLYISLEKATKVQVEIYDITGKLVSSQAKGNLMAGENKIIMNASELKARCIISTVFLLTALRRFQSVLTLFAKLNI